MFVAVHIMTIVIITVFLVFFIAYLTGKSLITNTQVTNQF